MKLERRNRVRAEGGMSSMTDLVFLLLIFFIIMSTMTNQALPVDLPSGNGKTTNEKSSVNVGVNESNEYFFEEDENATYTFAEIKPMLMSKMEESGQENIKIHGDRNADYEFVFNLIVISKQNGWRPVLVYK